jgi:hypothetical protein
VVEIEEEWLSFIGAALEKCLLKTDSSFPNDNEPCQPDASNDVRVGCHDVGDVEAGSGKPNSQGELMSRAV